MVKVNETDNIFDKKRFEEFCKVNKFEFPKAFIEYLEEHNDAELEVNTLDIGDNECCIRFFYGTSSEAYSDICVTYNDYQGRMPKEMIPIADPDFGNQICMSLAKETYGKIYFWDHETMDTDDDEPCKLTIEDMKEIASSFEELLDNIKESPYVVEVKKKTGFWSKFFGKF